MKFLSSLKRRLTEKVIATRCEMPTNLRFLEERFAALEKREAQHRTKSGGGERGRGNLYGHRLGFLADPRVEASAVSPIWDDRAGSNRDNSASNVTTDVPDILKTLVSTSSNAAAKISSLCTSESTKAGREFQSAYSHHTFGLKQGAADFFRRETQRREATRMHLHSSEPPQSLQRDEDLSTFLTATQIHANSRVDAVGEDGVHYRALFGGQSATPTPNESSGGMLTTPEEDVLQAQAIERLLAPTGIARQRMDSSNGVINDPTLSTSAVKDGVSEGSRRVQCRPQSSSRLPSRPFVRPQTAAVTTASSRKEEASNSQLVVETSTRPATASSAAKGSRAMGSGDRLVKAFFNALPPVVPPTGVAAAARRLPPPSRSGSANQDSRAGTAASNNDADREAARPPSSLSNHRTGRHSPTRSLRPIPSFAMEPDYYYLQIKIIHAAASITHWTFSAVVTNMTAIAESGASPRFQFKGLKTNANRYLIFQPPDNIIMDPLKQLPWAVSPASLYGHTLRLEVFATSPLQVKVLDSVVQYGSDQ